MSATAKIGPGPRVAGRVRGDEGRSGPRVATATPRQADGAEAAERLGQETHEDLAHQPLGEDAAVLVVGGRGGGWRVVAGRRRGDGRIATPTTAPSLPCERSVLCMHDTSALLGQVS